MVEKPYVAISRHHLPKIVNKHAKLTHFGG